MNYNDRYLRFLTVLFQRNQEAFCVFFGCTMLVSFVWSAGLENRMRSNEGLGKVQENIQTEDVADATWTDKIEIDYKEGLYIKTMDGKYSLRLHFLLHPQYQVADGVSITNTFSLRRGQMRFFGNFWSLLTMKIWNRPGRSNLWIEP